MKSVNLEFVFLPVDNDGCDLLIHEDEDDSQQSGDNSSKDHPHGQVGVERVDEPASLV